MLVNFRIIWLSVTMAVSISVLALVLTRGESSAVTLDVVPPNMSEEPAPVSLAPVATPIPVGPQLRDTAVAANFNPQVASVVEAQQTGKYPERLSLRVEPKPFDLAAFTANPQAYLNIVEPGRVYQTASGGPDSVPLRAGVDYIVRVPSFGSTPLTAIGRPNAPVSFTILDGGMFENRLSCTTVLADDKGTATVMYTATPGTVDDVQILVGSPLAVGTLTMTVHVLPPAAAVTSLSAR